ncbi:MAG: hypothetical protein PHW52_01510 [Candidatus Pacebacteria bacterium]|nr:hypothetical protein [Candidatus Paceibacterota bacterium]
MDKVYTSHNLIHFAMNEMKREVANYEMIEETLIDNYGKEEAGIAISILSLIVYFDFLIFGDNKVGKKIVKKGYFFASYGSKHDEYVINMSHIKKLLRTRDFGYFLNICKEGLFKEIKQSIEDVIISTAAHEVRHRIQYKKKIKGFLKNTNTRDETINWLIKYRKIIADQEKRDFLKERRTRQYVKARTSNNEFDANLIENYFLIAMLEGMNIEKMRKVLLLEPIRLFN